MAKQEELTTGFLAGRHSLFAFIYGFVRNSHDAEDIFQEVWLRFSRALADGTEIQDQARWCRATARNLILHHWRDRRDDKVVADQELFDLVELSFSEQDQNQDYRRAQQEALTDCIQELPDRSKALLRLKYEQGFTAEKIAIELLQSSAAILMMLSRIRKILKDCAQRKLAELRA